MKISTIKNSFKEHYTLILAVIVFFVFGLHHLSSFETVDEHFWKYDRIATYYDGWSKGLHDGNWKNTRINDKPGVTVALLSGIGMNFVPEVHEHRNLEKEKNYTYTSSDGTQKTLYEKYNTQDTKKINFALRFPLLIFNAFVLLPLMYFLLRAIFPTRFISQSTILFIGFSPILIGISQIINPDTLLWSTSAIALLAYLAHIRSKQTTYIILTGVFTGFALLSKYAANLLFVLFPLLFALSVIYSPQLTKWKDVFTHYLKNIALITAISFVLYGAFVPYTIVKFKHFLYGTIASPTLEPIALALDKIIPITSFVSVFTTHPVVLTLILASISFVCITVLLPFILILLFKKSRRVLNTIFGILLIILIATYVLSFLNAWTGTSLFPLDDIKETSRQGGELAFPQLVGESLFSFWMKAFLIQTQNFVFSLHPLTILLTSILWLRIIFIKNHLQELRHIILPLSAFPFIFFIGGLLADIFVNVRYVIMLYVPFALLSSVALWDVIYNTKLKKYTKKLYTQVIILFILALSLSFSLWQAKPHYFTYQNFFLPKNYAVNDSWGYGSYEAAVYLNGLENAEGLVVWTDRFGVCQFFVGHCITSGKIHIDDTTVDYLVFSRRGMIRKKFRTNTKEEAPWLDRSLYYNDTAFREEQTVHKIELNDHPKSFVHIIKVKK